MPWAHPVVTRMCEATSRPSAYWDSPTATRTAPPIGARRTTRISTPSKRPREASCRLTSRGTSSPAIDPRSPAGREARSRERGGDVERGILSVCQRFRPPSKARMYNTALSKPRRTSRPIPQAIRGRRMPPCAPGRIASERSRRTASARPRGRLLLQESGLQETPKEFVVLPLVRLHAAGEEAHRASERLR